MQHPFADLVGLGFSLQEPGRSACRIDVGHHLYNPQQVVHGAILYALADTGMGGALYPLLEDGEFCATIEIKISYFKYVTDGRIECTSNVVNKGKSIACLESEIFNKGVLVAKASGSFSVFRPTMHKS